MDIFRIKTHPAADCFPMIPADELNELAEDIKSNGLIHPLVIQDGVLIDGRNRREACKIAGVKPDFIELEGQTPEAYIVASNINRRHMTKGQRAMAVAKIYPDPKPGKSSRFHEDFTRTDFNNLSQARTILKYAPDLAEQVLMGSMPLSEAYRTALQRKQAAQNGDEALKRLREQAPDLADLVVEERMSLQEALAALDERQRNEKVNRAAVIEMLRTWAEYEKSFSQDIETKAALLNGHKEEIEQKAGFKIGALVAQLKASKGRESAIKLLEGV